MFKKIGLWIYHFKERDKWVIPVLLIRYYSKKINKKDINLSWKFIEKVLY